MYSTANCQDIKPVNMTNSSIWRQFRSAKEKSQPDGILRVIRNTPNDLEKKYIKIRYNSCNEQFKGFLERIAQSSNGDGGKKARFRVHLTKNNGTKSMISVQKHDPEGAKTQSQYKVKRMIVKKSSNSKYVMPAKRGKICISVVKRPSNTRKAVLWERKLSRQKKNVEEPQEPDHLDSIIEGLNFNKLKIIADPTLDFDIARNISLLNIFGGNYRHCEAITIEEQTFDSRDFITDKIHNLLLGPKCTNRVIKNEVGMQIEDLSERIMNETLNLSIGDRAGKITRF